MICYDCNLPRLHARLCCPACELTQRIAHGTLSQLPSRASAVQTVADAPIKDEPSLLLSCYAATQMPTTTKLLTTKAKFRHDLFDQLLRRWSSRTRASASAVPASARFLRFFDNIQAAWEEYLVQLQRRSLHSSLSKCALAPLFQEGMPRQRLGKAKTKQACEGRGQLDAFSPTRGTW